MTKMMLLAVLLFAPLGSNAQQQEAILFNAPLPAINAYTPKSLTISYAPASVRIVVTHAASGRTAVFGYPCAAPCSFDTEARVLTMIDNLNTANLSTRSLWRRIFDRLLQDFPERFSGGAVVQ